MRQLLGLTVLVLVTLLIVPLANGQAGEWQAGPDGKPVQTRPEPQATKNSLHNISLGEILAVLSLVVGALSFLFTLYLHRRSEKIWGRCVRHRVGAPCCIWKSILVASLTSRRGSNLPGGRRASFR